MPDINSLSSQFRKIREDIESLAKASKVSGPDLDSFIRKLDQLGRGYNVSGGPQDIFNFFSRLKRELVVDEQQILRTALALDKLVAARAAQNKFGMPKQSGAGAAPQFLPEDEMGASSRGQETLSRLQAFYNNLTELDRNFVGQRRFILKEIRQLSAEAVRAFDLGNLQSNQPRAFFSRKFGAGVSYPEIEAQKQQENFAMREQIYAADSRMRWLKEAAIAEGGNVRGYNRPLLEPESQAPVSHRFAQQIEEINTFDQRIKSIIGTAEEFKVAWDAAGNSLEGWIQLEREAGKQTIAPSLGPKDVGFMSPKTAKGAVDYEKLFGMANADQILPGGARAVENAQKALEKLGGSFKDIKNVSIDANSGITRFQAELPAVEGVTKSATVTMNRFGNVLYDSQRRFRSFFSSVGRDIGEFLKWSIAATVIYVPFRKLSDLMREAIEIQAKLADVQIALGASTQSLNAVFASAAQVAREMGTSVAGVVDGYVLAYRATGSIRNQTERTRVAEVLLTDSMTLAKLSGMDQAKALDTLVGALRQTGMGLDQGAELLDKWVAVTKVANVDLNTLAESFAITSSAAENAGLSVDDLNGLIAVMAEATSLSATESGNAIRGFIAGFQTDKAQNELLKYGISIRDATGELRSFTDVIDEIREKRDTGIISQKQLGEVANAIGGGWRRGAQVALLLQNYAKAQDVTSVSANASGDAQAALAIKLDTVQTAVTNLGNAFTELARTFGTSGGFLDLAETGVKVLTGVVDILNGMIKVLGRATPAVIALGVAFLALNKSAALQEFAGPGIMSFLGMGKGVGGQYTVSGKPSGGIASRVGGALAGPGGFGTGAAIGVVTATLSGELGKAISGDKAALQKTGLTIAGGIAGALISGGNPIGAVIGASIAEAFLGGIQDRETNFIDVFANIGSAANAKFGLPKGLINAPTPEATRQANELINPYLSPFGAYSALSLQTVASKRAGAIKQYAGFNQEANVPSETLQNYALRAALGGLAGTETEKTVSNIFGPVVAGLIDLASRNPEIHDKAVALWQNFINAAKDVETKPAKDTIVSVFGQAIQAAQNKYGNLGQAALAGATGTAKGKLFKGEITPTEYRRITEQGVGQVSTLYAALGEGGAKAAAGVNTAEEAYTALANAILNTNQDVVQDLIDQVTAISSLTLAYEEAKRAGEDYRANLIKIQIQEAQKNLATQVGGVISGQAYQNYNIPQRQFITGGPGATTTENQRALNDLIKQAIQQSNQELSGLGLSPEAEQKWRDQWGEIVLVAADSLKQIGTLAPGTVDPDLWNKLLKESGFSQSLEKQMQIITPDLASGKEAQIRQGLPFYEKLIKQLRPLDLEEIGVIFNDNVTKTFHTDSLAMQLLLKDIVGLQEKQLEGVFNLPEGMAAALPWTGALGFFLGGGGGGAGDTLTVAGNTLNTAGDKLITAADTLNMGHDLGAINPNIQPNTEGMRLSLHSYNRGDRYGIPDEAVRQADAKLRARQEAIYGTPNPFNPTSIGTPRFDTEGVGTPTRHPYPGLQGNAPPMGAGFDIQSLLAGLQGLFPESIPVTIKAAFETTNVVYIDSTKLQQQVNKSQYSELKTAKRQAGAIGYVVEA